MVLKMTHEEIVSEIKKGRKVPRRLCAVCREQINYALRGNRPILESCGCRDKGKSNIIDLTWDDLHTLVDGKA